MDDEGKTVKGVMGTPKKGGKPYLIQFVSGSVACGEGDAKKKKERCFLGRGEKSWNGDKKTEGFESFQAGEREKGI